MWRYVLPIVLLATPAMAAKSSVLCKAKDTGTIYTVVVIGDGNILFQVDAGEYLEGKGAMMDANLAGFAVNGTNGNVYMVLDRRDDNGLVKFEYNDGTQHQHPIHCVYK